MLELFVALLSVKTSNCLDINGARKLLLKADRSRTPATEALLQHTKRAKAVTVVARQTIQYELYYIPLFAVGSLLKACLEKTFRGICSLQ